MSIEILTFGCRLNAYESEVMRGHAAALTDTVIVNTCAVTAEAERQARQAIRRLAREKPEARIVVTGCAAQLDPALRARMMQEVARAPAWLLHGDAVFVHGGFHTDMLAGPAPPLGLDRPRGALARALYGEPTGRMQPDGFPERSLRWVDRIPDGLTVYCGHDRRSSDGRPYVRAGAQGGRAVFLDTGAGKGGHLSWIDLAPPASAARPLRRAAGGYSRS